MSNFVVSARKYRPFRFEDVVGQAHVTNTLKNALRNDHLAHAFLFCGPRGVGKTTCARILAKVLNCQNVTEDFEPCNECSSCQSFNENASFNITELDAASNNSVEHIRALIEQVRFQPQQGKYKVFIIDEVHMLSQQAFNAFLKTLEEPPSYAIFILATTEKHKIIPTILSRCQIFDFKRIQVPQMVAHLEHICQTEAIDAEPEALHVIGQKADGALRDALSIFDRIVSFSGKKILYQDVLDNLNVLDYDYFFRVVDALLVEGMSDVMLIFNEVINKGFDPDLFINGLAEHLRNLLVCKDPATIKLLEVSERLQQQYQVQAAKSSAAFLLTALNLANDCDINYKMARNKRLHVEMALIKMTYINRAVDMASNGQAPALTTEKKTPDVSHSAPKRPKTAEMPANSPQTPAPQTEETPQAEEQPPASAVSEPTEAPKPKATKYSATPKLSDLNSMLQDMKKDQSVQAELKPAKDLTFDNVKEEWNGYIEKIEQETTRNLLKSVTLQLKDEHIDALVSSKLVENTLRQEYDLIQQLRSTFGRDDLRVNIIIDKTKVKEAPKPKKPLTNKEKLKKMYDHNPNIKELAQRFGLRFDD